MDEQVQVTLAECATEIARLRRVAADLAAVPAPPALAAAVAAGADSLEAALQQMAAGFRDLGSRLSLAQQGQAFGRHIVRAQEEERRRLAREIHDGPAQLLANVVLRIDVCQRLADQDLQRLRDELNQLKDLVRLSLQDVRQVIFNLRPMALDDLGLVPALRAYIKAFQSRTATEVDLVTFGTDRRYEPTFEVAVFRLVQEALTNVDKHAQASRVELVLEQRIRELKVTVKDDGVGFEPRQVAQKRTGTAYGLTGMQERARLIGGRMEISSQPGQGTRIQLVFPVP